MKTYRGFWVAGLAVLMAACAGARRTDLTSTVEARLHEDPVVRAYDIDVQATGGVVTLKGNIDDEAVKERALSIARGTEGVVEVHDMIAVRTDDDSGDAPDTDRSDRQESTDAEITRMVADRLRDDPIVQKRDIDVDTREGVVFLTGTVESASERSIAIRLARETPGVRDVEANLRIEG